MPCPSSPVGHAAMELASTQLGIKQGTLTWWGVAAMGLWPPPSFRGGLGLGAGVRLYRTCAGAPARGPTALFLAVWGRVLGYWP